MHSPSAAPERFINSFKTMALIALSLVAAQPLAAEVQQQPEALAALPLAHELYTLGQIQKDALMILAAAKLAATFTFDENNQDADLPLLAPDFYAVAYNMVQADDPLREVITGYQNLPPQDSIPLILLSSGNIQPGQILNPEPSSSLFEAIALTATLGANLQLKAETKTGENICNIIGHLGQAFCLLPHKDGLDYKITIYNEGGAPAGYRLLGL